MFKPNEQMLKLKAFFQALPQGAYILYSDIEVKAGVKMDDRGKQLMRSALRSLKVEYRSDAGKGIELESDKNAMQLVTGRVRKVSSSLRRADRTTSRMTERYIHALPEPDRNRLLSTASLFGAIKAMSRGLSEIYKPKALNTISGTKPSDDPGGIPQLK